MGRDVAAPEHPANISYLENLSGLLETRGEVEAAIELAREVVGLRERRADASVAGVVGALMSVARMLTFLDRIEEAREHLRDGLDRVRSVKGEDLLEAQLLTHLARVELRANRGADAEAHARHALEILAEHPHGLRDAEARGVLGCIRLAAGSVDEARELLAPALAVLEQARGPRHPVTREVAEALRSVGGGR